MSRGSFGADGVIVRRVYGQGCDGAALWVVRDQTHDQQYIDAPTAAEARAEAKRRWARIDAERAQRAAEVARRRNDGVEGWPELCAAMWRVVLKGGA